MHIKLLIGCIELLKTLLPRGIASKEITGPFIGETQIGTKRVIYAETDCVWMTYHPTDLTDIAEIEDALLVPEEN